METGDGVGTPIICNNDMDEIYNNKNKWHSLYDNYTFYLDNGAIGILKEFDLRHWICNKNTVEDNELLREVCNNINRPHSAWIIVPFVMFETGLTERFEPPSCTNILDVAKVDFNKGQMIDPSDESAGRYLFSFGERVYDATKQEDSVVVGQTKYYAYILDAGSIYDDYQKDRTIKPIRRRVDLLNSTSNQKALNFRMVKECAAMEHFVVYDTKYHYVV